MILLYIYLYYIPNASASSADTLLYGLSILLPTSILLTFSDAYLSISCIHYLI